jgi:DNA-damage-inducible protein D
VDLLKEIMKGNIFEKIKKIDSNENEYWSARDLYKILGYTEYGKFLPAIKRAKESCLQSGEVVQVHFAEVSGPQKSKNQYGETLGQVISDFHLSRYSCYLIAQNGDPRKVEIAKAQTYFAIKTRQKEIQEKLIEDQKRVYLRNDLVIKNKLLASTAKKAGVQDFANFQDSGYIGLYGGLRQKEIKKVKNLRDEETLLDNIGSEELVANLFRASQAEAKIQRENIFGEKETNSAHKLVGQKVRNTIKTLGGTMPEDLPKFEHLKNSKKRITSLSKQKLNEL